jgi:hypothetical protein
MHIVLQNRDSRLYLQQPDQWIAEAYLATNFEHIHTACEFAREAKLPNLNVVMFFSDARHYGLRAPASR